MSKKLKIRTLHRNNLPYGKFVYIVTIRRSHWRAKFSRENGKVIEEMRGMLKNTCQGPFRIDHEENTRYKRVYTHIYLVNPMDVAMLKLCHHTKMHKIYKVVLNQPPA